MIAVEDREQLAIAIQRLPETERLALRMTALSGFPTHETAACMGLRPKRVRDALARARQMLRARLA